MTRKPMQQTRRKILRTTSALIAAMAGAGTATAAESERPPTWQPDTTYTGGDRVTWQGYIWEAKWWNYNAVPDESGVWVQVRPVENGNGDYPDNAAPTAAIGINSSTVQVGDTVRVDASGSTDTDGSITNYTWAFGDGATATGQTASHRYDAIGEYTITLTVTDDNGASDTAKETMSVVDQIEYPTDEFKVIGYYPGWKANDDYDYYPEDIPWDKVTDVQYAFLGVDAKRAVPTIMTDLDRQNLERLKELKSGPASDTRVKISVGGWADSKGFSDVAASESKRQSFAQRSIEIVREYDLDGVDIDWEHPGSQQGKCGCGRNADYVNQVKLLRVLRNTLNAAGQEDGQKYWLSIANGGSDWTAGGLRHTKLGTVVDYAMIMAYDFTGSWMDFVGQNAPINGSPHDSKSQYGKTYHDKVQYTVDYAIKMWNKGPNGEEAYWPGQWKYPASDGTEIGNLVLGLPFYGRGFNGTELYGGYNGLPRGTWHDLLKDGADPTGAFDFGDLEQNYEGSDGWEKGYHSAGDVPYIVNTEENTIISYDDKQSIEQKVQLAKDLGMQGVMFWELAQDWNETLLDTINQTS